MVVSTLTAPQRNAKKTHCKNGHAFTTDNTFLSKNPNHGGMMRQCKTCASERKKKRHREIMAAKGKQPREPRGMSAADWTARAEAYEECADYLTMAWTEDAKERAQGSFLERQFRKKGEQCRKLATRRSVS